MVERYANEQMKSIWSQYSKYEYWLKVQKAAIRAWSKIGLVSQKECEKIIKNAAFDLHRIEEIERETKHDVIAFLSSVSESLGKESRWLHYGLTSSDCIDTALALQIRDSLKIIINRVEQLLMTLKKRSIEHKDTICVGRSHGIHGEPITFGLVVLNWFNEIKRHKKSLQKTLEEISVGKISGAMGNFAHIPMELEEYVCEDLGLGVDEISNQIIQRDRHARLICDMALLASSAEKIAVNIRHMQRSEVYEAEEFFEVGQKGSSAMPHKRNPILSENITGLARTIRSFAAPSMENIALWHERDISHSSNERFILPDSLISSDFMLKRLNNVIDRLVIYPKNMLKNVYLTGGLVFSQKILLMLPKKGVSREEAYKIVQANSMRVWSDLQQGKSTLNKDNQPLFLEYLIEDDRLKAFISEQELKECFDLRAYTKNVDKIFKRVLNE